MIVSLGITKVNTLDTIGYDHIPLKREDKYVDGKEECGKATLSLMWSEGVNKGRISMERFVEVTAKNPIKYWEFSLKRGSWSKCKSNRRGW